MNKNINRISIQEAYENLRKAVRSVVANADTHDILSESLRVIGTLVFSEEDMDEQSVKKE